MTVLQQEKEKRMINQRKIRLFLFTIMVLVVFAMGIYILNRD